MTKVNERNPCAGFYGKSLDVKFTDECNGNCDFCIEKGGRKSKKIKNIQDLVKLSLSERYENIMILGGEPLTDYNNLESYSRAVFIAKKKVYITTNGSLLTPRMAEGLSKWICGINISIHHYDPQIQREIIGTTSYDLHAITQSIKKFNEKNVPVRINCNLIKGRIDNFIEVNRMIKLAISLGATSIRFSELQNAPDHYVDSRTIWKFLPEEPFTQGCEHEILGYPEIKVFVRMTCGIVNPLRPQIKKPKGRGFPTEVLYRDGHIGRWESRGSQRTSYDRSHDWRCH